MVGRQNSLGEKMKESRRKETAGRREGESRRNKWRKAACTHSKVRVKQQYKQGMQAQRHSTW